MNEPHTEMVALFVAARAYAESVAEAERKKSAGLLVQAACNFAAANLSKLGAEINDELARG